MKEAPFLKIIIVALLLLNLGTLAFLWMGNDRPRGRGPREDAGEFLTRSLQLSQEQQDQYAQMRHQHHETVMRLQEQANEYRHQFFSLLKVQKADSMEVRSLADSIAHTQQAIELITFYHFQEVRGLCSPQQQDKFNSVIEETLRMMAPGPPEK